MSPAALVEDITHLLQVWVAGWAGCRGYTVSKEGRFPAVFRADKTGEGEDFAFDPTQQEFTDLASKTAQNPSRILTLLTNDVARYHYLAGVKNLKINSASQTMM